MAQSPYLTQALQAMAAQPQQAPQATMPPGKPHAQGDMPRQNLGQLAGNAFQNLQNVPGQLMAAPGRAAQGVGGLLGLGQAAQQAPQGMPPQPPMPPPQSMQMPPGAQPGMPPQGPPQQMGQPGLPQQFPFAPQGVQGLGASFGRNGYR